MQFHMLNLKKRLRAKLKHTILRCLTILQNIRPSADRAEPLAREMTAEETLQLAEIQRLWQSGAEYNAKGLRQQAVAEWTNMSALKEAFLATAHHSTPYKNFMGESWTAGFGHIALLDFFAKSKILGVNDKQFRIYTQPNIIANQAYLNYWLPWFEVVNQSTRWLSVDVQTNAYQPAVFDIESDTYWIHKALAMIEDRWDQAGRPPLLTIDPEHHALGDAYLEKMGMPKDAWFVTLHVREGGKISGEHGIESIRNADVHSYMEAIHHITSLGGWVVRIGGNHFSPLPATPQVIDYAVSSDKQDALDVFFLAKCRFALTTNSGPAWVAKTFGTPVLMTNWGPIGDLTHKCNTMTLPRLLTSIETGKVLPFKEQLSEPLGFLESKSKFAELGVYFQENTPQEIKIATQDMLAMCENNWTLSTEENNRQEQFKQLATEANIAFRGLICPTFLENHKNLL